MVSKRLGGGREGEGEDVLEHMERIRHEGNGADRIPCHRYRLAKLALALSEPNGQTSDDLEKEKDGVDDQKSDDSGFSRERHGGLMLGGDLT